MNTFKTSLFLALMDLNSRFKTARLGLHWFYLQQMAWALGAGFVWSVVFNIELQEFLPFIIISFNGWNFLCAFIVDASATLQNCAGYLKNTTTPAYTYVNKIFVYSFIILLIGASPLLILAPFLPNEYLDINIFYFIISIVFIILCLSQVAFLISFVGVIVRDLTPALQSILQVLFVASPVIYPADIVRGKGFDWVLNVNPFFHGLEIIRSPVLRGELANLNHFLVIFTIGFAFFMFNVTFLRPRFKKVALYV